MKVLIISNLYPPHVLGGYELLCKQVSDELAVRGHQVTVLTSNYGIEGSFPEPDRPGIYRHLRLYVPFGKPAALMRFRRFHTGRLNYAATAKIIEKERPDVVFVWSQLRLTLGSARAAQDSGRPVAYTMNDMHLSGYLPAPFSLRPRKFAAFFLDHWLLPSTTLRGLRLDHVTCISMTLRDILVERGVPIQNASIIWQAIPIEQFSLKPEPGKITVPAKVLYTGQLHHYKGVHTLLEAAKILSQRAPHLLHAVSIVGDGPDDYKLYLRQLADQLPFEVNFQARIPHEQMSKLYHEHDLFVFPSIWREPFGLTHLEAMSSGIPVVSTVTGGQREFLEHQKNALVFEAGNAIELASLLEQLIQDPSLAQRLALTARAMVEHHFRLERYVDDIEEFLLEAIKVQNS